MTTLFISPPPLKPSEPGLSGASAAALLRRLGMAVAARDASIEWHRFALEPGRLMATWERAAGARSRGDAPARLKPGVLEAMRRAALGLRASPLPLAAPDTYRSRARYSAAVAELEQALRLAALPFPAVRLGIAMMALRDGRRLESSTVLAELAAEPGPFDDYFVQELLPSIAASRVRRVAVSLTFQQQGPAAFRLAALLRERLPHVERVLGGPLVACWQPLGVDFTRAPFDRFQRIVAGTDEELAELAREPSLDDGAAPGANGRSDRPEGFLDAARGPTDGNALPGPLLDTTKGTQRAALASAFSAEPRAGDLAELPWSLYFAPLPVVPAAFGRGCYWRRCTFCPDHLHPGHRACDPAGVSRFLHRVAARFPTGAMIHWTDSALPISMLEHVAETIARDRLPIGWHGFVRIEPELARPELAQRLAHGGCTMLQLGVETASPRLLELCGKGSDPALAREVLRATAAAGIRNQIYLLFGLPTERLEDREATLELVTGEAGSIDSVNPALLNLPRGSRMHRRAADFGITDIVPFGTQTDLSLYDDFRCGPSHPRVEARRWLAHRFFKAPSVRRIRAELRVPFKANHLCFIEPT